jgi:hypothetical protein
LAVHLQTLYTVSRTGSPADVAPHFATCIGVSDTVSYHFDLLYSGAHSDSFASVKGKLMTAKGLNDDAALAVRNSVSEDLCEWLEGYGEFVETVVAPFDIAECRSFLGGLLTHGLAGGVATTVSLAKDLCIQRSAATVDSSLAGTAAVAAADGSTATMPYSIPATIGGARVAELQDLVEKYIFAAIMPYDSMFGGSGVDLVVAQQRFLVLFVSIALTVFVLFMAVVYVPAIHAVNAEIKQNVIIAPFVAHNCMSHGTTPLLLLLSVSLAAAAQSPSSGSRTVAVMH